jgi:hypothetical protein
LIETNWIPSIDGLFKKPSQIEMNEIVEEITSGFHETPLVAEKLGIKDDAYNKVLRENPIFKELSSIPPNVRMTAETEIREIIKKYASTVNTPAQTKVDIGELFRTHLKDDITQISSNSRDGPWKYSTEDEVAKIRETYGSETQKKVNNSKFKVKLNTTKSYHDENFDPKTFLKIEYNGHCQICNTRLDLGEGKDPYFDTYRIIKESELSSASETEFNVICLCPNCHALAEHGGKDLSEILESVNEILSNNKIAEPVKERNGDFYVFNLMIAGKNKNIFYTQRHMEQIISVLTKDGK